MKNNKAITLIALIITIIVLLILAGITINMVLGENGLISKSKTSVGKYENAQEKENIALAGYETEIDKTSRETVTIDKEEYEQIREKSEKLGKLLWEGEWGSGSITVSGISNYTVCMAIGSSGMMGSFVTQGGSICMTRANMGTAGGNPITLIEIFNKKYTIAGDTLSTTSGSILYLQPGSSSSNWGTLSSGAMENINVAVINKIYGLF